MKKLSTNGTNRLLKDLGLELTTQDPNEFKTEGNLLKMKMNTYVNMYEYKAIRIHVNNLFATYGEEKVLKTLIDQFRPRNKICSK